MLIKHEYSEFALRTNLWCFEWRFKCCVPSFTALCYNPLLRCELSASESFSAPTNLDLTTVSRCKARVLFFDHSDVIHPPLCTGEHEASIGKREMSLTMCGCFQLTSEASYEYSDVAHCAPFARWNINRCNHEFWLNLNILSEPQVFASQAPLLNDHHQCVLII